ncbi:PREDICTED: ADP-ribosyl cyclase/cyclic ADP-ribose hydrolase 1-like isoform X2 [Nanorana parkeri]|uniref:ADP-ribosyl cyclase/cyclic ADP-ribose hydrolase 1-like isoform X2 n=1 Tax=Nanorana parkeri TaxID=125878 RepID=UPI000854A1D7|nr:PREDICTED: ADP-ribosyl cyclase/cyclic ADP-ribose hydrolase 1-like isoform X2 [Nanorana parkeri]
MDTQGRMSRLLCRKSILALSVIILASCYSDAEEECFMKLLNKRYKGPGTTPNLKNIIVGRCYHYMSLYTNKWVKDCSRIWYELTDAVFRKDPCNVTEEDYINLSQVAAQTIPCDKTLLWSRTNDLVHRYTKATENFMTLEDTFLGFLFNGLTWCGKSASSGMNYHSCPAWDECSNNSLSSFWKMASANFAQASCGIVNVMLNGSADGAITRKESILRMVEIPSMDPDKVSEVKLWVIDDIQGQDKNSCHSGSLVELQHYIEGHNLTYSCVDNYKPVQTLQCVDNPDHHVCNQCNIQ